MKFPLFIFLTTQIFTTKASKTKEKPNVLFIFVDDLRPLAGENLDLPNIRKLAVNGVNFKNAYSQQALCAPSRNSILTGRRPDSLHLYDFYSYWRTFSGNFTTIPQYFKQNGYKTISVGKVFHPGISSGFTDDYPLSWSYVPYHPPTESYKDNAVCPDPTTKRLQKNLICPVTTDKQPGKSLPDLQSLEYAIKILNTNFSQPFFLAVGFHKPHIPLKYPKEYLDMVPIDTVTPPKYPRKSKSMPLVAWHPWTDLRERDDIARLNISFPIGIMPKKWTLKIKQSYFAAAKYIDDLIGQLLKHVDNKTIVVLTSDHGWSLGENGLWAKYSNFDVALKVPLIVRVPSIRGKSITSPVELLDIFPTLVELAKLPSVPKCRNSYDKSVLCVEGKSLMPFIDRKLNKSNSFAISQYPRPGLYPAKNSDKPKLKDIKIMGYSIKTKQYRCTVWISFINTNFTLNWDKVYGIELYDHYIDPYEHKNLNLHSKYANITEYLLKILRSQIDQNNFGYK